MEAQQRYVLCLVTVSNYMLTCVEHNRSAELEALESQRKALEHERRQFAEVMIRLGNEKAIFEVGRSFLSLAMFPFLS